MELTLSDYLTGQSQLYFFRYFSLFSFTTLWKTLCKVKDLWGADLTPWTVSMKEGSPISHVTCCTIQMQIGSCNINCLNQFCKSCKFGGPGKRAAPIYIYIYCFLNYICNCFKCAITCHYVLFLLIIDFCGPLINVHMYIYIYISRYSWLALKECDPVFFTKRYHWNQRKPLFNSSLSFLVMPASINDCNFQYVQT